MAEELQESQFDMSPQHMDKADQYAEQLLGRIMELEARLDETQEGDSGDEPKTDMSPQHFDETGAFIDTSIFGINVRNDTGNVEVAARRIKRQKPSTYEGDLIINVPANNLLPYPISAGDHVLWLNYNLETSANEYSFTEGTESAVRLYTITVTASGEGEATTYHAEVTRIFRPGDVDIEPLWLPKVEEVV